MLNRHTTTGWVGSNRIGLILLLNWFYRVGNAGVRKGATPVDPVMQPRIRTDYYALAVKF